MRELGWRRKLKIADCGIAEGGIEFGARWWWGGGLKSGDEAPSGGIGEEEDIETQSAHRPGEKIYRRGQIRHHSKRTRFQNIKG